MEVVNDIASRNGDEETLRLLQHTVTAYLASESELSQIRQLRGKSPDFDHEFWMKLARQGWLGTLVPSQFGGVGLGFAAMRLILEQLARHLRPEPVTTSAVLGRGVLLYGDNSALKDELLGRLASGDLIVGFACAETTGALSALEMPACTVSPTKHGDELNGRKRFVVPAYGADGFIVSVRDLDELVLYWLPSASRGIAVTKHARADGTWAATLELTAVNVLPRQVIARGPQAADLLTRCIDEALVMQAVELYGVMDSALSITLEYMKTRKQFGRAIGSFQALQHRAVDLYIQKELALGAVNDAVHGLDDGVDTKRRAFLASRAKSRCADAALTITRECIKLHGAIGFADECDIGLYFQRALVLAAALGNGAAQRRRICNLTLRDAEPSAIKPNEMLAHNKTSTSSDQNANDTAIDWNGTSDADFRQIVRDYFERHYPGHLRYMNRRPRWSETREWALRMSRKGWIAPAWPREHGGMGLSPSKLIVYMEEQERWGIARAPDQGIIMLGPLLMRFGTPAQRERYLQKIISCEHIWCQGYSEPNAGSDLASLRTEAREDGNDYVVNGSKIWTTLAQDATHMFMLVRTDKTAKPQEGISFLLVDLKTPGVRIRPIRNIEGHEEFCEVFFDDVRVPKENLVGEVNKGWAIAKTLLGFERLNHGSPRRAQYPLRKIEMVARRLGLWPDAEFQAKYCKLRLDVDDLASAYGRYADIVRSGGNPGASISWLKIWATETFQRLTELLIEVAGEAGSLRGEVDLQDDSVDVLGPYYCVFPATIAAGSNEIQRNILAQRVLQLPR